MLMFYTLFKSDISCKDSHFSTFIRLSNTLTFLVTYYIALNIFWGFDLKRNPHLYIFLSLYILWTYRFFPKHITLEENVLKKKKGKFHFSDIF